MKQLFKARPENADLRTAIKRTAKELPFVLFLPLVAGLTIGISCGKKQFREIKPGPEAKAFYECQRGFKTEGLLKNQKFSFEISDVKGVKTPCAKVVREGRPEKGDNSYDMIDFNNDLKPDRIVFYCVKNIEGTNMQANLNLNVLRRKANALGDTIFTSDRDNNNGFSEAEMERIFADAEKAMKGVYEVLGVKEKLKTWKSPFRK
jgi:hypothetical protein